MPDGVLLPITAQEPIRFCRNPEQFGDGTATYRLRTNRPTWWLADELPWMPRPKLEELIDAGANTWSSTANVKATRASSREQADWLITTASLDGPGGVLADMQLPSPTLRQQRMRIDVAESALAELLVTILAHEFGHAYGLQHFPVGPPPELMEPSLNPAIRAPQPTEAALMAKWYGAPELEIPPATSPSGPLICTLRVEPTSAQVKCTIGVEHAGKKAELAGAKAW